MLPAEVLNNKGTQLMKEGKVKPALAFFRRASSIDPSSIAFRTNLGIALSRIPGLEIEAATLLKDVLAADPQNTVACHALGVLADYAGEFEDSLACYQRCQEIAGSDADAMGYSFDVATGLIRSGQWEEGWKAYECRRRWKPEYNFDKFKTWDGTKGKLVYCWAEQGLGDILQFSRYVPWLASQSDRVLFAVPAAMAELFKPFEATCDLCLRESQAPANADFEIPLMSLPLLYGKEIPEDPGLILSAPVKHEFSVDEKQLNVGVCWAASKTAVNLFDRQLDLEEMVQLAGDSSRTLYALQGDSRVGSLFDLGVQKLVQDMTPRIEGDWCATRDLIRKMDAVVTVDTSVAHLAGIMGKPTFLLIANIDTWRWTYNWYPTMTIIRQSKRGSWDAEFRLVDKLLDDLSATI